VLDDAKLETTFTGQFKRLSEGAVVWASRGQQQRFNPCGPEEIIKGD
jgi:hypothetical protein